MEFFWLAVGILGVWRLTHLLNAEDGPWNAVAHLRRRFSTGFWATLLDCFYCLSLWVAAPFAVVLGDGVKMKLLLWPALSAGAILLERSTTREAVAPAPYWKEEDPDVMLREEQIGRDRDNSIGG